ncbi:ESF1 homolog [Podarcis raffonei]|uniref:ESF1 homolog n=1 Tax=Podarcis raffonei TaxID=65483 RepID=UPI0023298663|nr:ESF1 homolog [Podarcis raffonei]XP_053236563.1 ESF1 homolog [Podarcis raffonei]XP_053236564.1 ESF1 homolog [Podarcis raffonei]
MESKKEIISDQRFSRITKDPRFWEMPEKDRKIKIDKRFQAMFHDKKFKLKYTVDKRGRPVQHSSTEDLRRFYDLSDSDSDLSESDQKLTKKKLQGEKAKTKEKRVSEKSPVDSNSGKESKGTDKSSSLSKLGILKNEGQKSKSLKSKKAVKGTQVIELQQVKELTSKKQNKQGRKYPENLKTVKEKAVKNSSIDSYVNHKRNELGKEDNSFSKHINEHCLQKETCENVEHFDLDELEGSEETEEESESEDSGDLEEESTLGEEGEMREESGSEDEEETGNESDIDESDSGPDLARGKGNIETSSDDDEEEEDLAEIYPKEPEVEHGWGELAKDAPRADAITRRLAVCNMDWDRLKAKDLLALLNSFTPKGGFIFSVKIYPSEFGKERMKEEEVNGPTELLSLPEDVTENDSIYKEKLRDYQFKRLKYFYAVVECDTPETANKIYEECDGLEFESSCSFVDLRFIPDDVTFDDEPKDVASEVDSYKPKYFTSAAVSTSKVDITWDETDHERVTSLSRTFKKDELLDMDFQAYLASSSEEEEEEQQDFGVKHTTDSDKHKQHSKDDEEQIAKYRELLRSIQEKEKKHQETDMEMEIKWVPGLKESAEEMVRNKLEGKDALTPWEQFLDKKKEKRKLKKKQKAAADETLTEDECPSDVDLNDPYFAEELGKAGSNKKSKKEENAQENEDDMEKHKAEMALLVMDDEEDERRHFNYDKIVEQQNLSKKKKKLLVKKKELLTDDFQVNVADARFQAMYTSHLFNLDPSDPNFKKTKAVEKILEEKARRREQGFAEAAGGGNNMAEPAAKKSIDPALSMLIKSVKNKTEQFQARKKQKVK